MSSPVLRAVLTALFVAALAWHTAPTHAAAPEPAPSPVAVLYFDYSGGDDEIAQLRKGLAQMLITDLSNEPRLALVERLAIESVLGELALQATRAIDRATAVKVGKLVGARFLVLGGYFTHGETLRIDARVIRVETGVVVRAVGVNGKADDFLDLERILADQLGKILVEAHVATPITKNPPKLNPGPRVERTAHARPARLRTRTAARYGKALDLADKGDRASARKELEAVLVEAPEFGLAKSDLARLVQ